MLAPLYFLKNRLFLYLLSRQFSDMVRSLSPVTVHPPGSFWVHFPFYWNESLSSSLSKNL